MIRLLAEFRYVMMVAVFTSFISSLLMLIVGTIKVIKIIWYYILGQSNVLHNSPNQQSLTHLSQEDGVTARIIESLDTFLVAAVLMYFAYGIYALFCARKDDPIVKILPPTIVPGSLGELKQTLGQIILVVLMVLFTRQVWLDLHSLQWEHLIIPSAVFLLGVGLRLSGVAKH